jgi:hypothetical protein
MPRPPLGVLLRPRLGLLLAAILLASGTSASAQWHLPGDGVGAAQASADFHAPSVTGATVAPVGATAAGGAVHPGGQFVVYANAFDPGSSGIASVSADVSVLVAGATAVPLSPCGSGCTVAGVAYGWSSAPLTAGAGLSQGTRTYGVWGADNGGNVGSTAAYSVVVDSTKPSVTGTAVAMSAPATAGWVHSVGSYAVYAKVSDGGAPASGLATVTADVSGLTPGTTTLALSPCTTGCTVGGVTYTYRSATVTAGAAIPDGAVTAPVTATDVAGNAASASAAVTADSTAPAVTAAAVANSSPSVSGFARPGASYLVYANASDAGGIATLTADVSSLTAGQTAVALTRCTSSCKVGGVTYGYKSAATTAGSAIPDGAATFTVTALDKAANSTTGAYAAAVDGTAPAISAAVVANTTTSAAGWLRKSGAYAVYADVVDAGGGVATVTADVSAVTGGQTALALSACTTGCTVDGVTYGYKSVAKTAGSTLAAGAVAFTVKAADTLGNSATGAFAATVDNTAPSVSGIVIATTATMVPGYLSRSSAYAVYADASDAGGINKVTAKVTSLTTGQSALPLASCTPACTVAGVDHGYASAALTAKSSLGSGGKTYTVTVQDLAGNSTTSPSQTVTVDNTAPAVAISFPTAGFAGGWAAGCGTAGTEDVCGTASDATAGIAAVQFSLRQSAPPNRYFDPDTASFSSATEVLMPAAYASGWTAAAASAWFTNLTGYTLRAVATDAAANTTSASTTFTFRP